MKASPLDREAATRWRDQLNEELVSNILPFWLQNAIDPDGGYFLHLDAKGKRKKRNTKALVTQARTLWLFSRASRNDFGGEGLPEQTALLAAARHGYEFLRREMWDRANGGFVWLIDPSGKREAQSGKHLYGQAFALLALCEYFRASGHGPAKTLARTLFSLIEERAHDPAHGGYEESFDAAWQRLPDGSDSYMGPSRFKLMNTHLHLMEALTAFLHMDGTPLARRRLEELVLIQSVSVVRNHVAVSTDRHMRDWTPVTDADSDIVSYGHNVENASLLMDANDVLGRSNHTLRELYEAIWRHTLDFGYDSAHGGLYVSGPPCRPAADRSKLWWAQAEAMLGAMKMYRLTGNAAYFGTFEQTWKFVQEQIIDREHGEWRPSAVGATFPPDKAQNWKAGYHNGRAMIECLKALRDLQ